jgi:hypothetical protein
MAAAWTWLIAGCLLLGGILIAALPLHAWLADEPNEGAVRPRAAMGRGMQAQELDGVPMAPTADTVVQTWSGWTEPRRSAGSLGGGMIPRSPVSGSAEMFRSAAEVVAPRPHSAALDAHDRAPPMWSTSVPPPPRFGKPWPGAPRVRGAARPAWMGWCPFD